MPRLPGGSAAQRQAIASLLRMANADLEDARLVVRRGQARNAAALGGRALASLVQGVAASEQGWPVEPLDAQQIPGDNPVQPDLLALEVLLKDAARQTVRPNGLPGEPPANAAIGDALERLDDVLETVVSAFGVDIATDGPAARADVIRAPEPPPSEPDDEAAIQAPDKQPVHPPAVVSARPPSGRRGRSEHLGEDPPHTEQSAQKPIVVGSALRGAVPTPDTASSPAGAAAVQSGPLLNAPAAAPDYTSIVFWALMERWKLSDAEALELIGHPGGLTKKGTRPRFRVAGKEAELFGHLREIDAALAPLEKDIARWMRQPLKEAPLNGATPLAYITRNGIEGSKAVERAILMTALRKRAR